MKSIFFLLILVISFLSSTVMAGMNSPSFGKSKHFQKRKFEISVPKIVFGRFIRFYSKVISPIDGPRSPSYPTGSAYGAQAVQKHGLLMGVILTADRMIHDATLYKGPYVIKYGVKRYDDPIENNTFWWDETVLEKNQNLAK